MNNNKAFLGINLDLLENPKYKNLDSRAMMLYALYADRYSASMNNARLGNTAFVDDMGVFIRFTNELAAKVLHVSKQKITDFRKELSDLDLIKVVREGLKGYKIYVYPVQQTPNNVELLLPWKNHTITVQKITSDWTILSKIEFCKNLKLSSQNVDINVSRISESTCSSKNDTSLSHSSLSHVFLNNNGLDNNACAREENEIQPNQSNKNPYHSLPEKIKSSFVDVFGFITKPMAIELHSLISQSNEDMVNYVITSSKGHKVTNAIAYIKAAITNALKRGDKCAQDMINFYNNNVKNTFTSRKKKPAKRFMSKEEVNAMVAKDEEEIRQNDPEFYARLQEIKRRSAEKAKRKPVIPMYKLGY
ncbi:replication protein, repA [Limosilactobacillus reuteri]|uniref:Replication protein, repA n=3 Tax=Limosilactobacillus reuteri TaxID=1598 RepID=A0ABD6Y8I8_LIMRT|nr:replication initiator protein A [Limosilactobacillus reuteri]PWT35284.1 replication protein, repA [Limosilactobacillus reuteri]PWT37938.1 replication protein, repA [Limosilactobacillus reuteri]PWT55726.1 replication protein, repA [Limosilactobacillus reuteri]PWT58333.1 replication protein, repA [Limosilactobacillus reuteri]PWT59995.1 replication protein, repA [Limosilactobacillus reuteri]